jgi:hypothetical protein
MAEQSDASATSMSVRPMTEDEQTRWPDAEVAFTIYCGADRVTAHAMTTVEAAREFTQTIEQVCRDVLEAKEPRDELGLTRQKRARLEANVVFLRCTCGILYALRPWCILKEASEVGWHACPNCTADVLKVGEQVAFAVAYKNKDEEGAKKLLPNGVIQVGDGLDRRYTNLEGKPIDPRS